MKWNEDDLTANPDTTRLNYNVHLSIEPKEIMSKCEVNSNSRKTGERCWAVSGIYSRGYLFSSMVILGVKPAPWNLTAERTIMNGSFAPGADRSQKCFHITVHLSCVCLRCIPECQDALFRDWGFTSSRDILRRFVNLRGPVRNRCFLQSVRLVVFNQKSNKCLLSFKGNDRFFILFPDYHTHGFMQSLKFTLHMQLLPAQTKDLSLSLAPVVLPFRGELSKLLPCWGDKMVPLKIRIWIWTCAVVSQSPQTYAVQSSQKALL